MKFRTHHIANGPHEDGKEYTSAKMGFFKALAKMIEIMKRNRSLKVWITFS
jgi:hypothetical protein